MKKSTTLTAGLTTLAVLAKPVMAQLPDEINDVKYWGIYQESKAESDSKRSKANQLNEQVLGTQSEITNKELQVVRNRDAINSNVNSIENLRSDNSAMAVENSRLSSENLDLSDRISETESEIIRYEREINLQATKRHPLLQSRRQVVKELDDVDQRINRIRKRLKVRKEEFNKASNALSKTKEKIQKLKSEKEQNEKEIQKATKGLPQLQQKKNKLASNQSSLDQVLAQAIKAEQTAQSDVNQAKQKVSKAQQNLDAAKAKTSELNNQINKLQKEVSQLQSSIAGTQSKIQKLNGEISNLESQISSNTTKISELKAANKVLADKNVALNADLVTQKKNVETATNAINRTKDQLKSGTGNPKVLRKRLREQVQRLNVFTKKVKSLNAQIASNNSTINQNATTITSLESSIASSKTSLASKKKEKKALVNSTSGTKQQIAAKNKQIASLKASPEYAKVAKAEEKLSKAKQQLSRKENALSKASTQVSGAKTAVSNNKKDLKDVEKKISAKTTLISKNTTRNTKIDSELASLIPQRKQQKVAFDKADAELAKVEARMAKNRASKGILETELDSLDRQITRLDSVINNMERERSALLNDKDQMISTRVSNNQRIVSNQNQMAENDQSIVNLQNSNADLNNMITRLDQEIDVLNSELSQLKDQYLEADRLATLAEDISSQNYNKYLQRKELKDQKIDEAISIGNSQGQKVGLTNGSEDGLSHGELRGKQVGSDVGMRKALSTSYFMGLLKGKLVGNEQGYNDGKASSSDYESGLANGVAQGKASAKRTAMKEDFPQAYANARTELLKDTPLGDAATQDNGTFKYALIEGAKLAAGMISEMASDFVSLSSSAVVEADNFSNDPTLSPEEIDKALSIESQINPTVTTAMRTKEQVDFEAKRVANPSLIYKVPADIVVDRSKQNCRSVYKAVQELQAECESAYGQTYLNNYKVQHKKSFGQTYEDAYAATLQLTFNSNIAVRFNEGKKESYTVVYNEAKARGAAVAYQKGVAEGKVKGFSDNIMAEREKAKSKGESDAFSHFQNNGVVRLRSENGNAFVKATSEKGMVQGSKVALGLKLTNIGKKASKLRDARVQVVSMNSNVIIEGSGHANITSLSARKNVDVTNIIGAKISQNALPGSEISLKAIVTYAGDDVQSSFREETIATAQVKVNPAINNSDIEFEKKTSAKKCKFLFFGCGPRTETVKVKLSPQYPGVPSGYNVEMTILEGSDIIKLEKGSELTPVLERGQEHVAGLKYKFKSDKTKDASIKLSVKVSYEGEVLSEKVIDIKVK